jgi:hypothetical protein
MGRTLTRTATLPRLVALATLAFGLSATPAAQAAGPAAPHLQSPAANARVQSLPTFEWAAAGGAKSYQFQLSADPRFGSVIEVQNRKGAIETPNTAATLAHAVANGTYYWRVRAVSKSNKAGAWSGRRKLIKAWTATPTLESPANGTAITWPTQPLVFKWSAVPYAFKYQVTVATDEQFAHQVLATASSPIITQGTVYTPSVPLPEGTYYWRVTPLDAELHKGAPSTEGRFTYTWPTTTTTQTQDLNPDPRVFDPLLSWAPVAGAARYEVEVNSARGFPPGSKWCCSGTTIGTSMAPPHVLANNTYYWRVRALDSKGNAGVWNEGPEFTKAFDSVTPSVPNLHMVGVGGEGLPGSPVETDTPIVTWDPVPGASDYDVQVARYAGLGCNWTGSVLETETTTTAWTPLGPSTKSPQASYPAPQADGAPLMPGYSYCVRILARSDNDAVGKQVTSEWTQLGGFGNAGFVYEPPPPPGSATKPFSTPAGAYHLPATGSFSPATPYFTWNRVAGANGYFVVIARDPGMTEVTNVGFTNIPAYAPRLGKGAPLNDETTAYYWAVMPSLEADGNGVFTQATENSPQPFNKSSVPPAMIAPGPNAEVSTQPTFRWTSVEGARTYTLQVSAERSFGVLLDNVTTDATAYTSSTTYPANTTLYWRVRGNDWNDQGLNWSSETSGFETPRTFQRLLPAPVLSPGNATGGEAIPVLSWSTVTGAIGYEMHIDKVDGKGLDFSLPAAAMTPVAWYGVGVWRWQVRAVYPTGSSTSTATSAYTPLQPFVRTLNAPEGARGVKAGRRIYISWHPDPAAKEYEVQLSTNDGFTSTIRSMRTEETSWAPDVDPSAAKYRGVLFWRVAAIDGIGNVGSYANGRFGSAPRPCNKPKGKKHAKCVKPRHPGKHR